MNTITQGIEVVGQGNESSTMRLGHRANSWDYEELIAFFNRSDVSLVAIKDDKKPKRFNLSFVEIERLYKAMHMHQAYLEELASPYGKMQQRALMSGYELTHVDKGTPNEHYYLSGTPDDGRYDVRSTQLAVIEKQLALAWENDLDNHPF